MRINELIPLTEKMVDSSWIADVRYIKPKRTDADKNDRTPKKSDVAIIVRDGRRYIVKDVPYMLYRNWVQAPSKGQFWHKFIKDKYTVV